ncbi:hypothetical protein Slala03_79020 [Streptomyces lavendulae subsp. lavendulae]|uniref:TfuA-like protein n=1 Tax=Streptomyces lavendulae TaxID=1914 RepID=UPI00249FD6D5|nr:TfuA-like protein [Streptomyces lavendulae]GLV88213.1 hypothetical protein Slala03_79020 [Streptomyces lavendulae subsp. lavendulae]
MTAVVFLGPSLPLDEARGILPDADFRPPAQQADVISAATEPGTTVIALIDGEFSQARSVWHKEILLALERGVHVFGASSMGALRAAELAEFGMVGRGEVFDRFASGELIDDDEVALTYTSDDGRYRHMSEPMVNIRATLAAAVRTSALTRQVGDAAVEEAKALPFGDRTPRAVAHALRERGLDAADADAVFRCLKHHPIDLKAQDARSLLEELRSREPHPAAWGPLRTPVAPTVAMRTLYDRERRVRVDDTAIALADIADHVQVHHPAPERLNDTALTRALTLALARLLEVTPEPRDVDTEAARWRIRHGRQDDAAFSAWLEANHLSHEEFRALAGDAARVRALRRWLLYSHASERSTRFVLDQLRWDDEYETWSRSAAAHQERVDRAGAVRLERRYRADPEELAAEHDAWLGHRPESDLATRAEEAGFHSVQDLALALARAGIAREELLGELQDAIRADLDGPRPPASADTPPASAEVSQVPADVAPERQATDNEQLEKGN